MNLNAIKAFWDAGEYEKILPLLPANALQLRARVLFWIATLSGKHIEELISIWPTALKHLNLGFEELQAPLEPFFIENPQRLKLLRFAYDGHGAQAIYFLLGLDRILQADKKAARYLSQSGVLLKANLGARAEFIQLLNKSATFAPAVSAFLAPVAIHLAKELKDPVFSSHTAKYLLEATRELSWEKQPKIAVIRNYTAQAKALDPAGKGLVAFENDLLNDTALRELEKALSHAKFSKAADIALSSQSSELRDAFFKISEILIKNSRKHIPPAAMLSFIQRLLPQAIRVDANHSLVNTLQKELHLC